MHKLHARPTSFALVAAMNVAFHNPKGDYSNLDPQRLSKQMLNVADELGEFYKAMGASKAIIEAGVAAFKEHIREALADPDNTPDRIKMRDAMCDVQVFAMGGQHFMGVDGDDDMAAVVGGVMTRFIKDDADKAATIAKHAAAGVTDVYFEGEYPTMVMKSGSDQPDAPKGKFLKSASFSEPVFPAVVRCTEERPCVPCFADQGPCDAAPCSSEPSAAYVDQGQDAAITEHESYANHHHATRDAQWPASPAPEALTPRGPSTQEVQGGTRTITAAQRAAGWGVGFTEPSDGGNND